jgi:DNA modification methylase
MKLINADCIAAMKEMLDNSVDSIVTDPPYELGFMGKSWDASGIAFNIEVWQEALRVLKPGGHLIAFSGSRTYHRMAVAIEDAGFQIRDQIMWVYGSGFPKSLDVSKAIDKRGGATANFEQFRDAVKKAMKEQGLKTSALADALGNFMLSHYLTAGSQPAIPNYRDFKIIRDFVNLGTAFDHLFADEAEREVVGSKKSGIGTAFGDGEWASGKTQEVAITAPATAAAQQWDGWGTALKPAHEPMVLARKPLEGTVANNVLTYGVGGLNIDGSRVGSDEMTKTTSNGVKISENRSMSGAKFEREIIGTVTGRFPANFIHDGSDEVVALFPGTSPSPRGLITQGGKAGGGFDVGSSDGTRNTKFQGHGDSGSAARFFYCAKASKRDRNEGANNNHPTVKPTDLMRYLCRLITPPNGTVLDPFMGSGSTGKAAVIEGFDFIGIDQSAEYVEIAKARIEWAVGESQ